MTSSKDFMDEDERRRWRKHIPGPDKKTLEALGRAMAMPEEEKKRILNLMKKSTRVLE